jgi:hypothetical protein
MSSFGSFVMPFVGIYFGNLGIFVPYLIYLSIISLAIISLYFLEINKYKD